MSGMNVPDPTEHFKRDKDQQMLEYTIDSRTANTGVLKFIKEDHTLGNLLRTELLRDNRVLFAGYRVPHPLVHETLVRVRTTPDTTPLEVARDAVRVLSTDVKSITDQFRAEVKRHSIQPSSLTRN